MMVAAAHLHAGDVVVDWPASDEPLFDSDYSIGRSYAYTGVPEEVHRVEPRSDNHTRRFITMTNGAFRCWDNTRLIHVTQRNTS